MAKRSKEAEREAMESRRQAALQTDQLGPGTAGYTISGAAYRGMEVAADMGAPSPADPGFPVTRVGLHPGQGVGVEGTTAQRSADLGSQDLNVAARPGERPSDPASPGINAAARPEGRSAVDMLTSPVGGETPENRR